MNTHMTQTAPEIAVPSVGDIIYVPSAAYCSHGIDDRVGGRAVVASVTPHKIGDTVIPYVSVKAFPYVNFNWLNLSKEQGALAARFGEAMAYPDPDDRPEFNEP